MQFSYGIGVSPQLSVGYLVFVGFEASFCLGFEASFCLGFEASFCLGFEASFCLGFEASIMALSFERINVP